MKKNSNLLNLVVKTLMPKIDENESDKSVFEEFQDKTRLFRLNRLLSDRKVILWIGILLFVVILLGGNYLFNVVTQSLQAIRASFHFETISIDYGLMNFFRFPPYVGYYIFIAFIIITAEISIPYKIRTSFKEFNVSQKGSERWATSEELHNQYISIPEKDTPFPGKGGVPVAWDRENQMILIDTSPVNNYIIGTTRSGKGESYLFTLLDIYSRAELKPSVIINDPKLEIYKMGYDTLKNRGFKIFLLNLTNPGQSNCFNPIQSAIDAWKKHDYATSELLVQSFSYSIFHSDGAGAKDERFWTSTSTNVLCALILAHISDCLALDEELNADEFKRFQMRKNLYHQITPEKQTVIRESHADKDFEAILAERNTPIEDSIEWQPLIRHEHEINMYSIIVTFSALTGDPLENGRTKLDEYFDIRPADDRARLKYLSAKIAGDKQKGNILSAMITQLTIFTYENIAKMTSHSDIDLVDIGFGKQPYAVFLSLPDYDTSNHFIASIFIRQLYFILSKHCSEKTATGKCTREVVFLLDEFGNIPAIESMENIATVCLGRNILLNLIVQSDSQVEKLYGKDAETIRGNCGNKYFLSSGDLETREKFSKDIGNKTITNVNRTGSKLSLHKTFTESYEERPLMNQNELAHLHEGENVVTRIMTRHDLQGKDIVSAPIFNTENSRFKYRYQYLTDTFPNLSDLDFDKIPWPSTKHIELKTYDIDHHFKRISKEKNLAKQKQKEDFEGGFF